MPEARDLHQIDRALEGAEGYQAATREHEQETENEEPSIGAGERLDVSLLESQQGRHKPEMSETKRPAADDPETTVSGKDERSDPSHGRATPPGERM